MRCINDAALRQFQVRISKIVRVPDGALAEQTLGPTAPRRHLLSSADAWVVNMRPLTDNERALLEKLASAGRPTHLDGDHLILGQTLEPRGLVLFVRNSASAVITPKGRHAITAVEVTLKPALPRSRR